MEKIKDFDSFYEIKIQPYIKELAKNERSGYNWKIFTACTAAGTLICFLLFHFKKFPSGGLLAGVLLLMCIVGIFFSTKYTDRYINDFKEKIITQIFSYIHPGSIYKPSGYISKKEYKASGLYRRRFTHFDGDDYWECLYDSMPFHCSEIESSYSDPTGSESIFKGLFFTVKLKGNFTGGTYVWTKDNVQLPGSIADEHYRMYPLPPIQKLVVTHEGFNRCYSVYTTNRNEASAILTEDMLGHMLLLKQKLKKDIVFSFVAGNCYVAVPFIEDLLEPTRSGPEDKLEIKKYFYTILLVFNIIRKLELNKLG